MEKGIHKRFVLGFEGTEVTPFIRDRAKDGIFGVILFERNFESYAGLKALCAELHTIRPDLVISIDQEGGEKSRLRNNFQNHPSNRDMARSYTPKAVEQAYFNAAVGLSELGIDWNLAPVVDLGFDGSYIYERTFSALADEVSEFSGHAIRGIQRAGLFACAKHFTGLGGSKIDPHMHLLKYNGRLTPHLLPFLSASTCGVDSIMTTHIVCEELDNKPVTVSEKAISLLRAKGCPDGHIGIGFNRVVITDDLLMGGSTEWGSPEEVSLLALSAGHDIALICKDEEVQQAAIELFSAELVRSESLRTAHKTSLNRLRGMLE
mgnify:CR=1 FL=1